jgi:hypothetical protein
MLQINGHWESVETLDDVVKIIREYYNEELADKMDEMLEEVFNSFNNTIEALSVWDDDDDWYDD